MKRTTKCQVLIFEGSIKCLQPIGLVWFLYPLWIEAKFGFSFWLIIFLVLVALNLCRWWLCAGAWTGTSATGGGGSQGAGITDWLSRKIAEGSWWVHCIFVGTVLPKALWVSTFSTCYDSPTLVSLPGFQLIKLYQACVRERGGTLGVCCKPPTPARQSQCWG